MPEDISKEYQKSGFKFKKESKLVRSLKELKTKLFWDTQDYKKIVITVERDPSSRDGYKYNARYEGNLYVPGILEFVAEMQKEMKDGMRPNEDSLEMINTRGNSRRDIFGFKRLARYLSNRRGQNA